MASRSFVIDGSSFGSVEGFYDEIQRVLTDDSAGFGKSLDAFDDILYGGFGRFDPGDRVTLVWAHSDKSRLDLGYAETARYFESNLHRTHPTNKRAAQARVRRAQRSKGETLFDMLVGIIEGHSDITLVLA